MNASGNRNGTGMKKKTMNGLGLARVGLAFVLVLAMAASLWFSSPTEVKALLIAITNPSGNPLDAATVTQPYNFQTKITIENGEFLPISNIDVTIKNTANPALYSAVLTNLPLNNGGASNYSNAQTGGGAANVTVSTTNLTFINSVGGGSVVYSSNTTSFPAGYGYSAQDSTATITYDIIWVPPSGWPAGNYEISTIITNNINIFTRLSALTLQPQGADVTMAVVLQGGSRPNPAGWVVPLTVSFFTPGADVLVAAPLYSYTQDTARSGGTANCSIAGIPPGTYDISVKSAHTLVNVKTNVVISSPSTVVVMGTLLEGNAREDTPANAAIISGADFSTLSASWNKQLGIDAGYNANADFDRNGIVSGADFSLLSTNWNKFSPITVP